MSFLRTDYIDKSVLRELCSRMGYENSLVILLSLETGLRVSDCLSLKADDLKDNIIFFTASKTGKSGKKKISSDLAKRLRKISGKEWIFEGRSGDKPRTRQAVFIDLKRAVRVLGINENVAPHSARKIYAVELYRRLGLNAVQDELQHDNPSTTVLYALSDKLSDSNNVVPLHELPPWAGAFAELVAEKVVEKMQKK